MRRTIAAFACRRHTRKKVVATVSRHERACKRIGEPSVPFCERGGMTERMTDFSAKKIKIISRKPVK